MQRVACTASGPPQPERRSRPHAQSANIVRGVHTLGRNQLECQRAEIVSNQTADCEMISAAAGQGRERRSGHRGTRSAGAGPVISRLPPPMRNQTLTWATASALARGWGLNQLADRLVGLANVGDATGKPM
jgi:hypothetical protein